MECFDYIIFNWKVIFFPKPSLIYGGNRIVELLLVNIMTLFF